MEMRSSLVLVAAMWVSWFDFGLQTTLGTLFLSMLDEFGENRSATACVQSIFVGVNQCLGVFSGILITRFGIPKVSITASLILPLGFLLSYFATKIVVVNICVGVVSAAGVSLMFVCSMSMLKLYFKDKTLPLALALHSSSVSFAGLSYPFLLNYILKIYGLSNTFLILGGYLLNNIVICIFFTYSTIKLKLPEKRKVRPKPGSRIKSIHILKENLQEEFNSKSPSDKSETNTSVVTSSSKEQFEPKEHCLHRFKRFVSSDFFVSFFIVLLGTGVTIGSQNGYLSVLTDILKSKGFTEDQGIMSFLPLNLSGLFARLIPGILNYKFGFIMRVNVILASVFAACGGIGQLLILTSTSYTINMTAVALTGIPMGGVISTAQILVAQIAGDKKFPVAVGLLLTVIGILASLCGPVYGSVRDNSENYTKVLIARHYSYVCYVSRTGKHKAIKKTKRVKSLSLKDIILRFFFQKTTSRVWS